MGHENGGWMNSDQREATKQRLPIEEDVTRAYIDGRNAGRRDERTRIRKELLAEMNRSYESLFTGTSFDATVVHAVSMNDFIAILDRICPEED